MIRRVACRAGVALVLVLALLSGAASAAPASSSTNQTLKQVLGNRQTLPLPLDPNLRLQQDRAYRQQLQRQERLDQGGAAGRRQQTIEDSGAALQQMRREDLDAVQQQLEELQQQRLDDLQYRYYRNLERKAD